MKKRQQQEAFIQKCLMENKKEDAIKLLFELVTSSAKVNDFKTAEAFRDQIFEIDPMALNEIIKSAEIIDAAKKEAIDKDHREVWAKFYDDLSIEEANAFYFALEHAVYESDATVFEQGEHKPRLYFINSGRPKLIYSREGQEVLLKLLGPGELAGQETFLFDSVYTTSMITLTRVELSFLDTTILKRWNTEFPVLKSKLFDFAQQSEETTDMLRAKGLDRRAQRRINVSGRGMMQFVRSDGDPVGKPFQVDLCDISQGGMCFCMQITKRETTGLLLGHRLSISYLNPPMDAVNAMGQTAIIVAARCHPFADGTVHVKFDTPISSKIIDELERLSPPMQLQN